MRTRNDQVDILVFPDEFSPWLSRRRRGNRYNTEPELFQIGQQQSGIALRATKANPELGGDVYLKLGNIRLRRNERDEAVRCWERALELDPQNAIVRTNLGAVRQVF